MPIIGLQICAQMESVTNLKVEDEDFRWCIKVRCENCGEESGDFVFCSLTESSPLKGSRGQANLVIKCKLCGRDSSLDILCDSLSSYTADDAGKFKTIVKFDCRGMIPLDFLPGECWVAEGLETKTPFTVNFNEMEWFDYDEKAGESVSITEFQFQFEKMKH